MEDIKKKIMKINKDEAVELLGFICGYHKIRGEYVCSVKKQN